MIFGLLDLSLKGYVIATIILTQITIAAVTIFLHRCQTHQALTLHPVMSHFFRFWLWLTTGMVTREWVAIHRKHHAKCETEEDPHSPKNWGLKTMLLKGAMVYRKARKQETVDTYGYGTPNDWIETHLYTKRQQLGIFIMLGADILLFGLPGLLIWLIQMAWIPFWAAGVINGIGHVFGYRNFETADASTNIIPLAFIVGGEELHNNHHAFPSSAKLSVKWWEFDMGWLYIKVLSYLGLAKIKRTFPVLSQERNKSHVDFDLVKVILHNKLQIMADYSRCVVIPSFEKECRDSVTIRCYVSGKARKYRKILTCSDYFLDKQNQDDLKKIMDGSAILKQVYHLKTALQQIWESRLSSEELVNAIKKWIEEAKQSGNACLAQFAESILHYSVKA